MWLYGSGFPKSMNISLMLDKKEGLQGHRGKAIDTAGKGTRKDIETNFEVKPAYTDFKSDLAKQWQGWGTALKPSFEPIIVARKPFKGSLVDNVIEYGVGGINIDECRVEIDESKENDSRIGTKETTKSTHSIWNTKNQNEIQTYKENGRFPANTILTYDDTDYEEVCGGFPESKSKGAFPKKINGKSNITFRSDEERENRIELNDSGSASRYFMNCKYTGKDEKTRRYIYTPKASKKDRDEGLDVVIEKYVLREDTPKEIKIKIEGLYEK